MLKKKTFRLYGYDLNEKPIFCNGLKELYTFLGRSKSSVYGTIWRIEQGKFNNIRNVDGKPYKLEIIPGEK